MHSTTYANWEQFTEATKLQVTVKALKHKITNWFFDSCYCG